MSEGIEYMSIQMSYRLRSVIGVRISLSRRDRHASFFIGGFRKRVSNSYLEYPNYRERKLRV